MAYRVILNAQLANEHINLNDATFPGQERGVGNGAANADTFLRANGNLNEVLKPHNQVDLRVCQTNEMAIEHAPVADRQVRAFFASDMVIATSNVRLQAAGSAYRLKKVDNPNTHAPRSISVGQNNPKVLYQVVMGLPNGNAVGVVQENCDDISGTTMGEPSKFQRTARLDLKANSIFGRIPRWTVDDDLPFRIAVLVSQYLFNGRVAREALQSADAHFTHDFQQAVSAAGNDRNAQFAAIGSVYAPIGEFYGTLMRKALAAQQMHRIGRTVNGLTLQQNLNRVSQILGINAFANARIGDAYMTYSIGKMERYNDAQNRTWIRMEDFVAPRPVPAAPVYCAPVWEFHWGAVVAESGAERITFENYARKYEDRDCVNRAAQEERFFFQMCQVPNSPVDLCGQSWHEACYNQGFANALTMAITKMARCGR